MTKLKYKNFNKIFFSFIKRFFFLNIRWVLTYNIVFYLLGFSLLTPLFVRYLGLNPVVYCAPQQTTFGSRIGGAIDSLFSSPDTFTGFTVGQIALYAVVTGVTFWGLGLAYDKLFPPFMRFCGWEDWYSSNEKIKLIYDQFVALNRKVDGVETKIDLANNNIGVVAEKVNIVSDQIVNVLYKQEENLLNLTGARDALVLLITGVQNTLSTITNQNINPLYDRLNGIKRLINDIHSFLLNQQSLGLSAETLRAEMSRLMQLYTTEQEEVRRNISEMLVNLRDQVNVIDTNDISIANTQLQSHIAYLEGILRTFSESNSRVRDVVETQIAATEQLENLQQLVTVRNTVSDSLVSAANNVSSEGVPPALPAINPEAVLTGVGASVAASAAQQSGLRLPVDPSTTARDFGRDLTTVSPRGTFADAGRYVLERRGDELWIRLSLDPNTMANLSSNVASTAVTKIDNPWMRTIGSAISQEITHQVTSTALTVGGSLLRGAATGGFNGILGSLGIAPVMRVMSSPVTQRALSSDVTDAVAVAGRAGEVVGTGLALGKSFVKAGWWVLNNV